MIIQSAERLSGIGEYYFARKLREVRAMGETGMPVINLGIGSPDLPPHPDVIDALGSSARDPKHHGYQPYRGITRLREAMASWYKQTYGVTPEADTEVLPLIGSKEGIFHLSMAFLNPGDEVLVPNPGYPGYAAAARLAQAKPVLYDLTETDGWQPDLDQLNDLCGDMVRMLWINYPHMPTGALASEEVLEELVAFARRRRIMLCHDNPYSLILNPFGPISLLAVPGAWECSVELNSLSKSHQMAGWRVGMMIARAGYIDAVMRVKSNIDSGMFFPVQEAAARALDTTSEWLEQVNRTYATRKKRVIALLELLGCRCTDGAGLFVWAHVPDHWESAEALSEAVLHGARVFITPGMIFGSNGRRYLRASLCVDQKQIEESIGRVKAAQNVLL